jgi:hypothetical protein
VRQLLERALLVGRLEPDHAAQNVKSSIPPDTFSSTPVM